MDYVNPIGKTGARPSYVDADPTNGVEGDAVSSNAWEHPMREILAVIEAGGLTPNSNDLTQLKKAIAAMIQAGAPNVSWGTLSGKPTTFPPSSHDHSYSSLTGKPILMPIGGVLIWDSPNVPAGFLKCNGASLNTSSYAALFQVLGYRFGGVGSTFNLPDKRGEFIRGWDDSRGIDGGRTLGSHQGYENAAHAHRLRGGGGQYHTVYGFDNSISGGLGGGVPANLHSGYDWYSSSASQPLMEAAGGSETRPRNLAVQFIIKYQ